MKAVQKEAVLSYYKAKATKAEPEDRRSVSPRPAAPSTSSARLQPPRPSVASSIPQPGAKPVYSQVNNRLMSQHYHQRLGSNVNGHANGNSLKPEQPQPQPQQPVNSGNSTADAHIAQLKTVNIFDFRAFLRENLTSDAVWRKKGGSLKIMCLFRTSRVGCGSQFRTTCPGRWLTASSCATSPTMSSPESWPPSTSPQPEW